MQVDAGDLSDFYETPVGQVARRIILRRVREFWPKVEGRRILGYGFTVPYLRSLLGEAESLVCLMPAHQGYVRWPGHRSLTALADESALPFADALFDYALVVHGVESAEGVRTLLRQLWRVLAPAGSAILVVPNRTSLWAQIDRSPFAHGRPFTRAQLSRLLDETMFVAERWDTALLFPPFKTRRLLNTGAGWERVGRRFWPRLAGVHIVEITKSLYGSIPVRVAADRKSALALARG